MGLVARMVAAAPLTILLVAILLAGGAVFVLATRFAVMNNTSDLLSDKSASKATYNEFLQEFGTDSRFIILIKGDDPEKNRQAADVIGPWLESLRPHITTVLYKIDYSSVKPRLLFTADIDQLNKIADEVENDVKQQKADQVGAQKATQTATDLNSILEEANAKFSDSFLRQKSNWTEFKPFVARFISVLDKISDQAEGKIEKPKPKANTNDTNFDTGDADEMLAQHEYFSLLGGTALLIFAYPGEIEPDSLAPYSKTLQHIREHLVELQSQFPGVELKVTGEPALDDEQIRSSTWDAVKAGGITVCLILLLFFFSYRMTWPSHGGPLALLDMIFLWRPGLTFFALILGVLWSLGFALISVGHFNILSIAVIPMVRTPGIWIVVAIVISIISAVSLPYLRFDYNLLNLQNQNAPAVKALYEVMDASKSVDDQTSTTGKADGDEVSTIYASVVTNNVDEARDLRTKLLALPEVARVDSPLDLIPTDQDKKMPIIKRIVAAAQALNIKPPKPGAQVDIPKAQADIHKLLLGAEDGLTQAKKYSFFKQ